MGQIKDDARRTIALALIAGLIVRPLDPGLTRKELLDVAVQSGLAPSLFAEVYEDLIREQRPDDDVLKLQSFNLTVLYVRGDNSYPDLFPMEVVRRVGQSITALQKKHGVRTPQTLDTLLAVCSDERSEVELAVGFLLVLGNLKEVDGGLVRYSDDEPDYGRARAGHPAAAQLNEMVGRVRAVLAASRGSVVAETPPITRFGLFLKKQGLVPFASWWTVTSRELAALSEQYPTATTVLAGSLLEGALTAISDIARTGGHWRQKFLHEKGPERWTLRELVEQAAESRIFDPADKLMADSVAELRNRIHAGRFHSNGKGPFTPRCVEPQESHLAKQQLDHLLRKILDWQPIAALL